MALSDIPKDRIAVATLQAISLANGKLKGHQYYLTKYQMINIAEKVLQHLGEDVGTPPMTAANETQRE